MILKTSQPILPEWTSMCKESELNNFPRERSHLFQYYILTFQNNIEMINFEGQIFGTRYYAYYQNRTISFKGNVDF